MPELVVSTTILFTLGAIVLHLARHECTRPFIVLLAYLSLTSIYVYANYGSIMTIRDPHDSSKMRHTYVHWHEIFHYYMGAKYYKELHNEGLYAAFLLADSESEKPHATVNYIRDLSNQTYPISRPDALNQARYVYRPKFSESRWEEFKSDLEYLKKIADNQGWLNVGMFDAGFNPPPTWCVIGYPIANLFPLSKNGGSISDKLEYIELLPLLDITLLTIAGLFIYRAYGFIGLSLFIIAYGLSHVASIRWMGGSFLRQMWLFSLAMGLCMMKEKRYMAAGAFLSFSSCMRIFPIVFAAGAGLWLLLKWVRDRSMEKALKDFVLGGMVVFLFLFSLSVLMFDFKNWVIFFEHIQTHSNMYFVAHLGYKKIATWADWVPYQNFWWEDGLNRFRSWNLRLNYSWENQLWFQLPFMASVLAAIVWAMRKMRGDEAMLLFGGMIIFFQAIPANYYYAYFALLPMVFFQKNSSDWRDYFMLLLFLFLWALLPMIPHFGADDLTHAYWNSAAIFTFFLIWLGIRLFHKDSALAKYLAVSFKN